MATKSDPINEGIAKPTSPFTNKRVHMIGVGGTGMRAAAAVLLRQGAVVSGSDRIASGATSRLAQAGATVHIGQKPENLPDAPDLVVISAAIKESNPELLEARRRGCPVIKYAELLGRFMRDRAGVAIAGTHGKSTTAAMTAFILKQALLDPTFVIGASVDQLGGGSGVGDGAHFVVEACEFDRSFLNLAPRLAAILNIEEDHLDCYASLDEIVEAFAAFASLVPADGIVVANREDRAAAAAVGSVGAGVESFGFEDGADWQAGRLEAERGCFAFDIIKQGACLGRARLSIPGRHHVGNALAATALAWHCGADGATITDALAAFRGARRRLTNRGQVRGIVVLDDYAHHPTEIQVTLRAARDFYQPQRMCVVFQPHQHSRTRFLLNDFARSFGLADVVVVPDIYFVRDSQAERDRIGAEDLVERIRANGGEAAFLPEFDQIVAYLTSQLRSGDLVITMGAGDVWKVADELVCWLGIDL